MLLIYAIGPRHLQVHPIPTKQEAGGTQHNNTSQRTALTRSPCFSHNKNGPSSAVVTTSILKIVKSFYTLKSFVRHSRPDFTEYTAAHLRLETSLRSHRDRPRRQASGFTAQAEFLLLFCTV